MTLSIQQAALVNFMLFPNIWKSWKSHLEQFQEKIAYTLT